MNPISYLESKQREKINQNIFDLYEKEELRTFKLTGPSSIGKSFTLFFYLVAILIWYILI